MLLGIRHREHDDRHRRVQGQNAPPGLADQDRQGKDGRRVRRRSPRPVPAGRDQARPDRRRHHLERRPAAHAVFQAVSQRPLRAEALVVGPGLKTGMPILYENPLEVGADRVVASIAAFEKYGGPCIVVDFGTATTFDADLGQGRVSGRGHRPRHPDLGRGPLSEDGQAAPHRGPEAEARPSARRPWPACSRASISATSGSCPTRSPRSGRSWGRKPASSPREASAQIAAEIPAIEAYEPHLVLEGLRIVLREEPKRPSERRRYYQTIAREFFRAAGGPVLPLAQGRGPHRPLGEGAGPSRRRPRGHGEGLRELPEGRASGRGPDPGLLRIPGQEGLRPARGDGKRAEARKTVPRDDKKDRLREEIERFLEAVPPGLEA